MPEEAVRPCRRRVESTLPSWITCPKQLPQSTGHCSKLPHVSVTYFPENVSFPSVSQAPQVTPLICDTFFSNVKQYKACLGCAEDAGCYFNSNPMFINIIFYVRDQVIPQGKQNWQGLIKMHLTTIKDRALETICWDAGAVLEEVSAFTVHKIMKALLAVQQRELPASSGRFPRRLCQGGCRGSCHQRTHLSHQLSPLPSLQSLQTQSLLSSH